jgi:hypothetical protein
MPFLRWAVIRWAVIRWAVIRKVPPNGALDDLTEPDSGRVTAILRAIEPGRSAYFGNKSVRLAGTPRSFDPDSGDTP